MSKVNLNNLVNLQNETSVVGIINNNNDALEDFSNSVLSRDGSTPNQMLTELDMNSQRILNLPAPVSLTEPIRVTDLEAITKPIEVPGNVIGPVSSTPGDIPLFSGTSGKILVDSGVSLQTVQDTIDTKAPLESPVFVNDLTTPTVFISNNTSGHFREFSLDTDDKIKVYNSTGTSEVFEIDDTGNVTANKYYGDGTTLTGVETSSHSSATYSTITRSVSTKTSNYTFALSDNGNVVSANNTSTLTFTIPTNASVAFPTGTQIDLININTAKVTISASGGVTLKSANNLFSVQASGSATLVKYDTNAWLLNGSLIA